MVGAPKALVTVVIERVRFVVVPDNATVTILVSDEKAVTMRLVITVSASVMVKFLFVRPASSLMEKAERPPKTGESFNPDTTTENVWVSERFSPPLVVPKLSRNVTR